MFRTLNHQTTAGVIASLTILLLLAGMAIASFGALLQATTDLNDHIVPQTHASGDFVIAITRYLGEIESAARTGDLQDIAEARTSLADAQTALDALLRVSATNAPVDRLAQTALYQPEAAMLRETTDYLRIVSTGETVPHPELLDRIHQSQDTIYSLQRVLDDYTERELATARTSSSLFLQRAMYSLGATFSLTLLLTLVGAWLIRRRIVRPLGALADATAAMGDRRYDQRVLVTNRDEIGALQIAFNTLGSVIQAQTLDLEQQVTIATAAQQAVEIARAELEVQLRTVQSQRDVIREMSVPILPLTTHTFVMPLVGALDTARLRTVQDQALRTIEKSSATCIIMDITGVPLVDSHVAQGLLQTIQAARLLGAEITIVGVRPEVAQSLTELGVHLGDVVTRSSLQQGIAYALSQDRRK